MLIPCDADTKCMIYEYVNQKQPLIREVVWATVIEKLRCGYLYVRDWMCQYRMNNEIIHNE